MSTFPDQFRLDGRTALVTGSGRGLGWEMVKALAEAGARVLLHGRRPSRLAPQARRTAPAGIRRRGPGLRHGRPGRHAAAIAGAGPVDILIHNVGERDRRPFAEIEPEDFARLIDVDLSAAHALVRLVVPGMIEQRLGPADPGQLDRRPARGARRLLLYRRQGRAGGAWPARWRPSWQHRHHRPTPCRRASSPPRPMPH